jgi:hypothetical protein
MLVNWGRRRPFCHKNSAFMLLARVALSLSIQVDQREAGLLVHAPTQVAR